MYLRLAAREDALAKSAEQEDANKSQQPAAAWPPLDGDEKSQN